jgi:hypothetical protein
MLYLLEDMCSILRPKREDENRKVSTVRWKYQSQASRERDKCIQEAKSVFRQKNRKQRKKKQNTTIELSSKTWGVGPLWSVFSHLSFLTLEPTLEVERNIGLAAVQYCLVAAAVLTQERQGLDDPLS